MTDEAVSDRSPVHVGTPVTALEQAYAALPADRAHGIDAVLLAPTREQILQLNERPR